MIRAIVFAVSILAAMIAHARADIVDINDVAIPAGLDLEAATTSITAGAVDGRWTPKVVGPGHVEARLYIRSHVAIIDITFDDSAYSITYKDSENLDYKDGRIHRNYNRWVANLNQALQRRLATATAGGGAPTPPTARQATAGPQPGSRGVYAGETVTIPAEVPVHPATVVPGAFSECPTGAQIASFLHEGSRRVQIGSDRTGHYIDMAITEVHMPGGGAWSGPKWLEVTGTLHEGDGDAVASFRAKRYSTGGAFAAFKGNCSIIGRCARAIAKDIAGWLRNPIDGAELGDAL